MCLSFGTTEGKGKPSNMDWQTIFSIAGIVLLIALMMRGGGMGCCGMGSHGKRHSDRESRAIE